MDNSLSNPSHIGKKSDTLAGSSPKNRVVSTKYASSLPLKDRLNRSNYGTISSLEDLSKQASRLFSPYRPVSGANKSVKSKLISKKRITAKSFNKDINFNYLSTKPTSKQDELPETEETSPPDKFVFSKEQEDKIKEQSERFFQRLTKHESNADYSKVVVFKRKDIERMIKAGVNADNDIIIPLLNHSKAGSSGLVVIEPKSQCGPLINVRGTLIVVFLDVEDNKVSFESSSLKGKKKIFCSNQNQLLILPNDAFILYNDSTDKHAKICVLTSKRTGKELKYLRKVEELKAVGNLF